MFRNQNAETTTDNNNRTELGSFTGQAPDIILSIMSYLDPESLANLSCTNKKFTFFSNQDLLIKTLLYKYFKIKQSPDVSDNQHSKAYFSALAAERKKIISSFLNPKLAEQVFDAIFNLPHNFISGQQENEGFPAFVILHSILNPRSCKATAEDVEFFNNIFGIKTDPKDTTDFWAISSRSTYVSMLVQVLFSIPTLGCTHTLDLLLKNHKDLGKTMFPQHYHLQKGESISFLHAAIKAGQYAVAKQLIPVSDVNLYTGINISETNESVEKIAYPLPLCFAIGRVPKEEKEEKFQDLKTLIIDLLIAGAKTNKDIGNEHLNGILYCKMLIEKGTNKSHLQEILKILTTPVEKLAADLSKSDKPSEKKPGCRMM